MPQLQAGVKVAEKVVPEDAELSFRPVATYGKGSRKHIRDSLNKKWKRREIKFGFEECVSRFAGFDVERVLLN